MQKTFYLTTTLPYVNADPHIGFALEIIAGDVISRYHRMLGEDVVFNTGTDEHGQKIYENAINAGQDPQAYTDFYAAKFEDLKNLLDLSYTHFIRTTNPQHKKAAQEFWLKCQENGDIYKKLYKIHYCVGCELEKQASELVDNKCPLHPNKELEIREEENYFFKFSKYQDQLLNLYDNSPEFVKPESKMKEIKAFVAGGLQDFSISRLKEKMPWGVSVPNDEEHVMYVWFDALVNYISTIGWPHDMNQFNKYWPVVQLAGKDNLRQQAAMWQAMLMSAQVPVSQQILINGFISVDGQKMSKSLGNVISPKDMVARYGTDGTRFLLMNLGTFGNDMDVTIEKFDIAFNAHLSNGIGNLCSRIAKLCEKNGGDFATVKLEKLALQIDKNFEKNMDQNNVLEALEIIKQKAVDLDQYLSKNTPWKLEGEAQKVILDEAVKQIILIAQHYVLFMPNIANQILNHFNQTKITALSPLFPRLTKI